MKNGICHGFSKSTRFSITFCMDFGSFFVVFFVAFFGRAFSKKCRCCKVRHARILWFLQWILTISTFYMFLAKAKKSEILVSNFDAKNLANSGQKFRANPMPKIMEFHQKSMEIGLRAGFSGHFVASGHFLLPRSALQRPDATWQRPRSGPWHVASGPWHVASGPWPVASGSLTPVIPNPPVAERSGYSGRYILYIYIYTYSHTHLGVELRRD